MSFDAVWDRVCRWNEEKRKATTPPSYKRTEVAALIADVRKAAVANNLSMDIMSAVLVETAAAYVGDFLNEGVTVAPTVSMEQAAMLTLATARVLGEEEGTPWKDTRTRIVATATGLFPPGSPALSPDAARPGAVEELLAQFSAAQERSEARHERLLEGLLEMRNSAPDSSTEPLRRFDEREEVKEKREIAAAEAVADSKVKEDPAFRAVDDTFRAREDVPRYLVRRKDEDTLIEVCTTLKKSKKIFERKLAIDQELIRALSGKYAPVTTLLLQQDLRCLAGNGGERMGAAIRVAEALTAAGDATLWERLLMARAIEEAEEAVKPGRDPIRFRPEPAVPPKSK